jgi:hypothetical protein
MGRFVQVRPSAEKSIELAWWGAVRTTLPSAARLGSWVFEGWYARSIR